MPSWRARARSPTLNAAEGQARIAPHHAVMNTCPASSPRSGARSSFGSWVNAAGARARTGCRSPARWHRRGPLARTSAATGRRPPPARPCCLALRKTVARRRSRAGRDGAAAGELRALLARARTCLSNVLGPAWRPADATSVASSCGFADLQRTHPASRRNASRTPGAISRG